jgi:hypothetical protein
MLCQTHYSWSRVLVQQYGQTVSSVFCLSHGRCKTSVIQKFICWEASPLGKNIINHVTMVKRCPSVKGASM